MDEQKGNTKNGREYLKITYPKGTNAQSTQETPRHNSSNSSKIQNWLKP